jgi:phage-related protein
MPGIGPHCHELRVKDEGHNWRIVYRIDARAVLVVAVFAKTTQKTPKSLVALCRSRLAKYDRG